MSQCHGGEGALEHGRHQRGSQALARDVGDDQCRAVPAEFHQVEIVTAHSQAGAVHPRHLEVWIMVESFREQRLLDFTGDGEFLLESPPFLFLLNQPGLVENACCLSRKSIQDFTVKRRKCGRTRAVKVEHSQQRS